jgi:hypothetical protein
LTRVLKQVVKRGMCEAHLAKPASCHTIRRFLRGASALAQDVTILTGEATSDAL